MSLERKISPAAQVCKPSLILATKLSPGLISTHPTRGQCQPPLVAQQWPGRVLCPPIYSCKTLWDGQAYGTTCLASVHPVYGHEDIVIL